MARPTVLSAVGDRIAEVGGERRLMVVHDTPTRKRYDGETRTLTADLFKLKPA